MMMNALSILLAVNSVSALRGGSTRNRKMQETAAPPTARNLSSGLDCTVDAFVGSVGSLADLAALLGTEEDETSIQEELDSRCEAARTPTIDLSDTTTKGPQFLKNFIDGGTTWNDNYENDYGYYNLATDAAIIPAVYGQSATTQVFTAPNGGADDEYSGYFSNFYTGTLTDETTDAVYPRECRSGAMACCYTGNRTPGSTFVGNAEMCALDMTPARQSNHINRAAFTYYDTQADDDVYCTGFAYDEGSFGDDVKYNTLFHMAMMTNLYTDGYVKNIPGAPMCGCVEQMPIISHAKCTEAVEGYSIDATTGEVSVSISWADCGDLAAYYDNLPHKSPIEKDYIKSRIVGSGANECEEAGLSFMNDRMYVPIESEVARR